MKIGMQDYIECAVVSDPPYLAERKTQALLHLAGGPGFSFPLDAGGPGFSFPFIVKGLGFPQIFLVWFGLFSMTLGIFA